jgi:hypothetical protein
MIRHLFVTSVGDVMTPNNKYSIAGHLKTPLP